MRAQPGTAEPALGACQLFCVRRLVPTRAERLRLLRAELQRLEPLPANSAYAAHRRAVCTKCIAILEAPKTSAAAAELDALFASLSL